MFSFTLPSRQTLNTKKGHLIISTYLLVNRQREKLRLFFKLDYPQNKTAQMTAKIDKLLENYIDFRFVNLY